MMNEARTERTLSLMVHRRMIMNVSTVNHVLAEQFGVQWLETMKKKIANNLATGRRLSKNNWNATTRWWVQVGPVLDKSIFSEFTAWPSLRPQKLSLDSPRR